MSNDSKATKQVTAVPVSGSRHGAVHCIAIDSPPVNALNSAVRTGLLQAIEAAEGDVGVQAIVIVGRGGNFIAGADIREFGKPYASPTLPDLCNRIEACNKPVVAALNGAVLGGGLEIALAAHYRVALADAKLGLPEVQLGLIPGAGGTVRAPRVIGAKAALDMMLSGRPVNAKDALASGLVDRVGEGQDVEASRGRRHGRRGHALRAR